MARLMGKHKMEEWQELDHTNPDSEHPISHQKTYLEAEWKMALGQGWMFKWIEEPADALVPA